MLLVHKADLVHALQEEYKAKELIGTLECGHKYHVNCIKQWLMMKNLCPICKTTALSSDRRNG
jgi:E3 ubiquitin-protein ligase RNF38/44